MANLNILYFALRNLRNDLDRFADVDDGVPNEAMRMACEIDEAMGDTPLCARSVDAGLLNDLIDRTLDCVNPMMGC